MPSTYPTLPPGDTLLAIQTKVRRLTRSPSQAQLDDDALNDYINTFVIYDFPEQLRTFNLREPFNFTCNPYQDVYPTNVANFYGAANASSNPLYNFQNNYITVHPPVYIAGFQQFYTQSREQFFSIYPRTQSIASINQVGNGVQTLYSGTIQTPLGQPILLNAGLVNQQVSTIQQNTVLFSSVDINGNGLAMVDVPAVDALTGNPTVWGSLVPNAQVLPAPILLNSPYITGSQVVPTGMSTTNYINYTNGNFAVTFPVAPGSLMPIVSQTTPQVVGLPQALLYYNNEFTLRPIPDMPYTVNFEVYARPTRLLQTNSVPALEEYWQFISYGAARKIFQDRMDIDSVALIEPEFKAQLDLCNRRTLVQITNERTATIYTEQTSYGANWGAWGFGG